MADRRLPETDPIAVATPQALAASAAKVATVSWSAAAMPRTGYSAGGTRTPAGERSIGERPSNRRGNPVTGVSTGSPAGSPWGLRTERRRLRKQLSAFLFPLAVKNAAEPRPASRALKGPSGRPARFLQGRAAGWPRSWLAIVQATFVVSAKALHDNAAQ